jgi:hypothetical protein
VCRPRGPAAAPGAFYLTRCTNDGRGSGEIDGDG